MATIETNTKRSTPRIDMTPMVDLGFLLLTFFIFTTTFSEKKVMTLNMPSKDEIHQPQGQIKKSNTLTLVLGENNRIFWHKEVNETLTTEQLSETDYSAQGIRQLIQDARTNAKNKDKFTVIVQPTNDCVYQNVVDVLDELAITNIERQAIVDLHPRVQSIYEQKKRVL
jgi:biopolymer transport protein ExbD